ncbi:paired amphipathic helix protein Sin3a [Frankliniella occidentalis]|uniref:Paired amphipathic helix protein Sin3a n=1 Tax=Frankliniella occidentalis TaxID=133901 RepID=A0A6J1SH26_FRAOC|nr:paired amphipathic helix protein Sin3a [Frankliniella occidentalis]XP_052126255.1 paired amphipathic helix protein Sin3a [Frankliniella occidentalis]
MKRRVEEAAKQEGSSSSSVSTGLSGRTSGPPGGPAIVYSGPVRQHHNRGITPPGLNTVSSPSYLPASSINKNLSTLSSDRTVGSSAPSEVPMPAFSIAPSYSSTMPGATAIKTAVSGLQGGTPAGPGLQTTLHTLQAPPQVLTQQQHVIQTHQPIRHKVHTGATTPPAVAAPPQQPSQQSQQQFQKLKVEDALSYLDQVKFKFGNQPQVYNDFLDIMKEFKSQSIDTPGVIARVSDLFKGHPELIVGFNTFLPPGYKIEVQQNDQGFAFQVSVSIPSPTASTTTVVHTPGGPITTSTHGHTTLITPIGPPGSGASSNNIVVTPLLPPSTSVVTQGVPSVGVPTSTPPLQSGQPVSIGKPVTIISSSGPLVSHHPTPMVATSNHNNPSVTSGPTAVPVLLSNSSAANPVSVSAGTTPHHASAPVHHAYPQPSVVPTAPPPGSTVPHGVNSVSSTSGAQTSIPSHHNTHPTHAPHHLTTAGTNLHHAGMAQAVSQAHQAVSQGLPHGETIPHSTQSQPVEFNHAINYVNKIKNRFQGQPDKYKRFLEILHTYQKEQRNLKEGSTMSGNSGGAKHLTEAEVYSQVAKLFENQEDLLAEFGQFLPDATSHQSVIGTKVLTNDHHAVKKPTNLKLTYNSNSCSTSRERDGTTPTSGLVMMGTHADRVHSNINSASKFGNSGGVKRSPSFSSPTPNSSHHGHHQHIHSGSHGSHGASHGAHGTQSHGPPPPKKHKACIRDVTLADAGKFGTLNDYAFFDNVRKALRSQEVYTNFLRCLQLFNEEVVSKTELVQLVTPFLGKYPELFRRFKDFIGACEGNVNAPGVHGLVGGLGGSLGGNSLGVESIPNNVARQDRPSGEHALEIDYSTCKRLGASYCALPKNYTQPKCTGRTTLCKEVLNDTWVSFPTWSEDSTFVTSRKTQYEEYIYRCEDERFELDVVIETNAATIRVLEGVHKKLQRLSPEEVAKFRLDDCLGGASPTIHQRALKRIYGDKAADIIDGLKKNPSVAVPVVLRRLKAKEEEWREAQKGFNKLWREQNEKYYLKSLDHQGINFKQNDVKQLRSKSLFNEIETLFDERHEQAEEGSSETTTGPHLVLPYKDKTVLNDAAELLIHHVKRQTSIHKEDKQRIKQLLRHFLPDLFFHPRQELSDDERDDAENDEDSDANASKTTPGADRRDGSNGAQDKKDEESEGDVKPPPHAVSQHPDECYSLFFGNNNWYLFYRLHHILCERLTRMYDRAVALANEEAKYRVDRKESTAIALRLKPKNEIDVEDYYPAFLDMVRNVLDGNMDSNAYEDTLREMFGIHAYIAFTLDKVVTYAVRQLQHLVSDDPCTECQEIFLSEQKRGGTAIGGPCSTAHLRTAAEVAYQRRAEQTLAEENCFKVLIYKRDCKVTIELLDTESEEQEQQTSSEPSKWTNFVDRERRFSNSEETNNAETGNRVKEERDVDGVLLRQRKAVFLARNVRRKKLGQTDVENEIKGIGPVAVPVPVSEGNDASESEKALIDRKKKEKLSSDGDEEMEVDEDVEASGGRRQSKQGKPKPVRLNHKLNIESDNLDGADELQCHFNQNSYRMVYVINRDNYLYREQALPKARQSHPSVSTRLNNKFRSWHNQWAREHVSDSQQKSNSDWLMGRGEGVVPNRTRVLTNNDISKPPYRIFNRYRVDRLVSESASSAAVPTAES